MQKRLSVFILIVCLIGTAVASGPTSSSTAQSIGVNTNTKGAYTYKDSSTYDFNGNEAAGYFTNSQIGDATTSCSGAGCGVCTNIPQSATAPPPDTTEVVSANGLGNDFVGQQRCIFLDGGTLLSKSYTQSVTISGSCMAPTKKNWKQTFTWPYQITPTGPVAPYTAWDLVKQTITGTPIIPIQADVAGESIVISSKFPTGKYSFSLTDSTGSRVTGVTLTITDSNNLVILAAPDPNVLGSTLTSTMPANGVNFPYTGNAGTNGSNPALGCLLNGSSFGILNGSVNNGGSCWDKFAGNDNGGSDGSAAQLQHLDEVDWAFPPSGNYTLTIAGTVKGNTALLNQSFRVNSLIQVVTPGCSASITH